MDNMDETSVTLVFKVAGKVKLATKHLVNTRGLMHVPNTAQLGTFLLKLVGLSFEMPIRVLSQFIDVTVEET